MFILIFVTILLISNILISHLIGKNGEDRKIGYGIAFLVSFLLSPIIGLLLVISSKHLTEEEMLKIKIINFTIKDFLFIILSCFVTSLIIYYIFSN